MDDLEGTRNGDSGAKKSQLIITLDHDSFALSIGGTIVNFDCALAMRRMAAFELEGRIRAEQARVSLARPMPFNLPGRARQ